MMKSTVNVMVVCLLLSMVKADSLRTNFLSPPVDSYDQVYRYYFTATGGDSNVAYVDSNCSPRNKFSYSMAQAYMLCGAHDFEPDGLDGFVHQSITEAPHQVDLYLQINDGSAVYKDGRYYNLMECLYTNSVMDCLSDIDREMIECLKQTTNITLHHQHCTEPLSAGAVIGIIIGACVGLFLIGFGAICFVNYRDSRRRVNSLFDSA